MRVSIAREKLLINYRQGSQLKFIMQQWVEGIVSMQIPAAAESSPAAETRRRHARTRFPLIQINEHSCEETQPIELCDIDVMCKRHFLPDHLAIVAFIT